MVQDVFLSLNLGESILIDLHELHEHFFLWVSFVDYDCILFTSFIPEKAGGGIQQCVLLIASFTFYYWAQKDLRNCILFAATIIFSYAMGLLMAYLNQHSDKALWTRLVFCIAIIICASPLLLIKLTPWFPSINTVFRKSIVVPLGVSFYTLQIIAYISDCYSGKIKPEKNFFRYSLFISFFPQIIQGPIPRYESLMKQLNKYHKLKIENITRGIQLIIWGFFLKLMIADKVVVIVNKVFDNVEYYAGIYIALAAILYSIQLYTDFYACVSISQGVSKLFDIQLQDNFRRPYFSTSIKDFWRRWHITLSTWFRDYIYIPLGGSRRGAIRTYINIIIVFLISGLWHGSGYNFLIWGLLHGMYQIMGNLTFSFREKCYRKLGIDKESIGYRLLKRAGTFFWVTVAWVFFRAANTETAINMFRQLFMDFNPWLLFGKERFSYGLDVHDWFILICSIIILLFVSACQEKDIKLQDVFARQQVVIRWIIYIIAILAIWIFGTYGYGFNAADFIYGGF